MARINMLLIHDWDYNKYSNMTSENEFWFDYIDTTKYLSNYFSVYRVNLPGFCHQAEPKDSAYKIEDYCDFINKHLNNNMIDANIVIGFGFGADVALKWKTKYKRKTKLVLISPKLFAQEEKESSLSQFTSLLGGLGKKIRTNYDIKKEKIPELVHGNPFMQNTYYKIRNVEMFEELIKVPVNDLCVIYGTNDQTVDSLKVFNLLSVDYRSRLSFINGGNHDLLKENYRDIVSIINTMFGIQ